MRKGQLEKGRAIAAVGGVLMRRNAVQIIGSRSDGGAGGAIVGSFFIQNPEGILHFTRLAAARG